MVLWGGLDSPGEVRVDTSAIRVQIARIAVGHDTFEDVLIMILTILPGIHPGVPDIMTCSVVLSVGCSRQR